MYQPTIRFFICARVGAELTPPSSEINVGQGRYAEAEELSLRGIKIDENTLGPEHPHLAMSLTVRARILRAQARNIGNCQTTLTY